MKMRKSLACCLTVAAAVSLLAGCSSAGGSASGSDEQVVIYSNADDEALRPSKTPWTPMVMKENTSYRASAPLSSAENCWQRGKTWKRIWSP